MGDTYTPSKGVKKLEEIDTRIKNFTEEDWDIIKKKMEIIMNNPEEMEIFNEFIEDKLEEFGITDGDLEEHMMRMRRPELFPDLAK